MNEGCCNTTSEGQEKFDLIVVGAGSAGFSAAITAAEQGARVALIGSGMIGGTCVNVGCVPSKAMIRAADALHHAKAASRFAGIKAEACIEDWRALTAQKDELVTTLRHSKYSDILPSYKNVAYIEGAAKLAEGGVSVDGKLISADKVIVATGTSAATPNIEGIDGVPYLTSTEALELDALPKSILVIGGGYIGCELAQMLGRSGVDVTIVCRSRLLPEAEPQISKALAEYFRDEGITVRDGLGYNSIRNTDGGIALDVTEGGQDVTIVAEQVLITTGRIPNTSGMGLEEIGVELLPNGSIKVDDRMRSTRPGVYAAGDVTGTDQFVYMAAYGAKIAASNAMNGNSLSYDNSAMPAVVFTDPQVASVGLTERQAKEQGIEARTSILTLDNVPRALAARDTRGLIKLVADGKTKKLIGAHILAPEGSDSIQTAALAIKTGMTYDDLGSMIFPYLTTVEGLKLAAQTFDMDVKKLSCCAG
ncbi:MAG: mercury(II) reductase [Thalassospira sp.]|uniref:mercury(II) reductase n=1 Tax=Thalassospira TaxID=168934 RepID=UPI0002872D15|nr:MULTISPECIES: mercury(II) reductase [Thalassospira]EKF07933.1 mercuric reductase [Thalassospira profundimaris WP0211]MBO6842616.1 mercury(II) reductase [Thalassospira sp.]